MAEKHTPPPSANSRIEELETLLAIRDAEVAFLLEKIHSDSIPSAENRERDIMDLFPSLPNGNTILIRVPVDAIRDRGFSVGEMESWILQFGHVVRFGLELLDAHRLLDSLSSPEISSGRLRSLSDRILTLIGKPIPKRRLRQYAVCEHEECA